MDARRCRREHVDRTALSGGPNAAIKLTGVPVGSSFQGRRSASPSPPMLGAQGTSRLRLAITVNVTFTVAVAVRRLSSLENATDLRLLPRFHDAGSVTFRPIARRTEIKSSSSNYCKRGRNEIFSTFPERDYSHIPVLGTPLPSVWKEDRLWADRFFCKESSPGNAKCSSIEPFAYRCRQRRTMANAWCPLQQT